MAQAFPWFGRLTKPVIALEADALQLGLRRGHSSLKGTQSAEVRLSSGGHRKPVRAKIVSNNHNSPAARFKALVLSTLAAVAVVAQSPRVCADNSHIVSSSNQSAAVEANEADVATKAPLRTWLEPFRQSGRKKADSTAAEELLRGDAVDSDSVLSEYSQAPDKKPSVVSESGNSAIRRTGHAQELAPLQEPAELMNGDEEIIVLESETEQAFYPSTMPESVFTEHPQTQEQHLCWQLLPNGLLYKTYLAGEKEPRMQLVSYYDTKSKRKIWEAVLGGRVGLIRLSDPSISNSDAFQLDLDGAVFARVLPDEPSDPLEGSDYRVGLYGTWKSDRLSYRAGYYHISAHVGDEYLIANPLFNRINYVRDSFLAGTAWQLNDTSRVYGEIGYALGVEGGAKPLEFQFGGEYAPIPTTQFTGAPFAAVNTHLREDFDFNGGVNVVAGWGWQGPHSKRRLRLGLNYYNGPSLQYEFFDRWENLVGGGIWLDY